MKFKYGICDFSKLSDEWKWISQIHFSNHFSILDFSTNYFSILVSIWHFSSLDRESRLCVDNTGPKQLDQRRTLHGEISEARFIHKKNSGYYSFKGYSVLPLSLIPPLGPVLVFRSFSRDINTSKLWYWYWAKLVSVLVLINTWPQVLVLVLINT